MQTGLLVVVCCVRPQLSATYHCCPTTSAQQLWRRRRRLTGSSLRDLLACDTGEALEPEVYPRPDGSVYICGSPEGIALPNDPNTIQVDPKSVEDLKEVARSVSSKLAEAPLEVGQSCFLPISPDGLPVMGKVPGVQGAYIASGPPPHLPPPPARPP